MKLVNQQVIKNNEYETALYFHLFQSRNIQSTPCQTDEAQQDNRIYLVDELIEREFIVDSGIGESDSIGRKPNCLQVRMNSYYIVVMNWHENTVEAYLVDIAGTSVFHEARKLSER